MFEKNYRVDSAIKPLSEQKELHNASTIALRSSQVKLHLTKDIWLGDEVVKQSNSLKCVFI